MKSRSLIILAAPFWVFSTHFVYAQTSKLNTDEPPTASTLSATALSVNQTDPVKIDWHKTIGGVDSIERAGDIIGLPNGDAVFSYTQFINDDPKLKIQRVNATGDNVWDIDLKYGDYVPSLNKIVRLEDGSIIGVGTIWEETKVKILVRNKPRTVDGKFQPYAVKFSPEGEIIWQNHFPIRNAASLTHIDVNKDGKLVFAGVEGLPFVAGGGRVLIIKVNEHGDSIWQKQIGLKSKSKTTNYFNTMIVDNTDTIVINGRSRRNNGVIGSAGLDATQFIIRMSQKGQIISKTEFKDMRGEVSRDALLEPDGNMIVAGLATFEDHTENGMFVASYTPENKVKWRTIIKDPEGGIFNDLIRLPDGKLIAAGAALASNTAREDRARFQNMVITCLSKDGKELWTETYGNLGKYGIKAMDISTDDSLWVMSEVMYSISGQSDVYLAKLILADFNDNL